MDKEIFEVLETIDEPILETILVDAVEDFCLAENSTEYVEAYISLLENGISDKEIDNDFEDLISAHFINTAEIYEGLFSKIKDKVNQIKYTSPTYYKAENAVKAAKDAVKDTKEKVVNTTLGDIGNASVGAVKTVGGVVSNAVKNAGVAAGNAIGRTDVKDLFKGAKETGSNFVGALKRGVAKAKNNIQSGISKTGSAVTAGTSAALTKTGSSLTKLGNKMKK